MKQILKDQHEREKFNKIKGTPAEKLKDLPNSSRCFTDFSFEDTEEFSLNMEHYNNKIQFTVAISSNLDPLEAICAYDFYILTVDIDGTNSNNFTNISSELTRANHPIRTIEGLSQPILRSCTSTNLLEQLDKWKIRIKDCKNLTQDKKRELILNFETDFRSALMMRVRTLSLNNKNCEIQYVWSGDGISFYNCCTDFPPPSLFELFAKKTGIRTFYSNRQILLSAVLESGIPPGAFCDHLDPQCAIEMPVDQQYRMCIDKLFEDIQTFCNHNEAPDLLRKFEYSSSYEAMTILSPGYMSSINISDRSSLCKISLIVKKDKRDSSGGLSHPNSSRILRVNIDAPLLEIKGVTKSPEKLQIWMSYNNISQVEVRPIYSDFELQKLNSGKTVRTNLYTKGCHSFNFINDYKSDCTIIIMKTD